MTHTTYGFLHSVQDVKVKSVVQASPVATNNAKTLARYDATPGKKEKSQRMKWKKRQSKAQKCIFRGRSVVDALIKSVERDVIVWVGVCMNAVQWEIRREGVRDI